VTQRNSRASVCEGLRVLRWRCRGACAYKVYGEKVSERLLTVGHSRHIGRTLDIRRPPTATARHRSEATGGPPRRSRPRHTTFRASQNTRNGE
jgi:hypothetical protein